jgi:hypothetical protein
MCSTPTSQTQALVRKPICLFPHWPRSAS